MTSAEQASFDFFQRERARLACPHRDWVNTPMADPLQDMSAFALPRLFAGPHVQGSGHELDPHRDLVMLRCVSCGARKSVPGKRPARKRVEPEGVLFDEYQRKVDRRILGEFQRRGF